MEITDSEINEMLNEVSGQMNHAKFTCMLASRTGEVDDAQVSTRDLQFVDVRVRPRLHEQFHKNSVPLENTFCVYKRPAPKVHFGFHKRSVSFHNLLYQKYHAATVTAKAQC